MSDQRFNAPAEDGTLADSGFRCKAGIPATLKISKRREWNERMTSETRFSLWERIDNAKRRFVRIIKAFKATAAYRVAFTNLAIQLNKQKKIQPLTFIH